MYEYQPINEALPKGSLQTFQYLIDWPILYGNYLTQVTLGGINNPPSINACWVFTYSINY